jgi:hypothetical protein
MCPKIEFLLQKWGTFGVRIISLALGAARVARKLTAYARLMVIIPRTIRATTVLDIQWRS